MKDESARMRSFAGCGIQQLPDPRVRPDWTIARYPMKLTNGPQTGHYRTGYLGKNVSMQLSRSDGANFVIQELAKGEFVKKAPVISY